MQESIDELKHIASRLRADAVRMVHRSHASHLGSCLSMADIVACLYWNVLRIDPSLPAWADRDRFFEQGPRGSAALCGVGRARIFPGE